MANNELKRVGLVFTEEGAVDFKKTLQEVNLELNKNYNQFKLTQAQWDSSVKSTEKLRAEQEYLKNAYEIQADKVSTLKMQLSDLENAENKDTTAIKKKRNELTSAEIKLETYNKRLKEIDSQLKNNGKSLEEWGDKVQKSGEKIEKVGKKLSAFSAATGSALVASAKTAIDFESAFAGVEKTVDGTAEQMEELKTGIRNMAKEIPSSTTEISAVAEAAGQLGIKTENILSFSKAMIDLGNSTNLTADEAASQLAKFANIMNMSQKDFDRLGSSIVDLGNHFATTEADIVEMSMRLAGAGKQVGLSEGQVLGLATALSSVGIEAEMGGSAISKAMVKMQNAVEMGGDKLNTILNKTGKSLRELELMSTNNTKDFKALANNIGMTSTELKQFITAGKNLEDFAKVSGKTAQEFKKDWKKDAAGALSDFIKGLGNAEEKGESAITMLTEMGLTEVRLRDSLLRAANAGNLFNDALKTGTKAWEDNTALTKEANKRYDTLKSKLTTAINKLKDMAITVGNKLMPSIERIIDDFGKWIKSFDNLSDNTLDIIVKLGLFVTAAGPAIIAIGKITSTIGGAAKGIGTFVQAIGVASGKLTSTSGAVNNLANLINGIVSPAGLATIAIAGITAAVVAMGKAYHDTTLESEKVRDEVLEQKKAYEDLNKEIDERTQKSLMEIDKSQELANELRLITDENGKIKEGYEARAKVITNELAKSLGTEIEITDNVIDKYKELKDEIDKLILKKQAELIFNASEEKYSEAIKNRTKYTQQLFDIQDKLTKAQERYSQAKEDAADPLNALKFFGTEKAQAELAAASKELENLQTSYKETEKLVEDSTKAISDYWYNSELVAENTSESLKELVNSVGRTYESNGETVEITYKRMLQEQDYYNKEAKKLYEQAEQNNNTSEMKKTSDQMRESKSRTDALIKELTQNTSIINENSPDIVEAWKYLATSSYNTYYDNVSKMPEELQNIIQKMTGVTIEQTPELVSETENMMEEVLDEISQDENFRREAINNLQGLLNGMSDSNLRELLKESGVEDADKFMEGVRQRKCSRR